MVYSAPWLINSLTALLIAVIGIVLAQIISNIVKKLLKGMGVNKLLEKELGISINIVKWVSWAIKWLVYVITLVLVLSQLGIPTKTLKIAFLIILALTGIFIILSSRDWIPNLIAGMYIKKTKKLKTGDTITVKGIKGEIRSMGSLEVEIKTPRGERVFIPNTIFIKEEVVKQEGVKNGFSIRFNSFKRQ